MLHKLILSGNYMAMKHAGTRNEHKWLRGPRNVPTFQDSGAYCIILGDSTSKKTLAVSLVNGD